MVLEPINSAMTYTAQPVASQMSQTRTVTEKPAEEFTEGSSQNSVAPVDASTVKVDAAEETDAEGKEQGQENPQQQPQPTSANADRIKKAVEEMNKKMANSEAQFGIHEGTNRVTIKIVDKKTKDIIKELPPEKTLDMIAKVWEMAGILVDEKR